MNYQVSKVWTTDRAIWVELADGQRGYELWEDYPRLRNATRGQREDYQIQGVGIRWETLDEDLSFEGFFTDKGHTELYKFFIRHPEINASALARSLGISQSLFAQYISGHKRPSKERKEAIIAQIQTLAKELMQVTI